MADSPASDDSVVTVINVAKQEQDNKTYNELVKSRREIIKKHYKLVQDTMVEAVAYSEKWHFTNDTQEKMKIGTNLVEKVLRPYVDGGRELAKDHHAKFKMDPRMDRFSARWSKFVANTIKGSRGDMQRAIELGPKVEPVDFTHIEAAIKDFQGTFRGGIQDGDSKDVDALLTSVLDDEPSVGRKEWCRQLIFERYQEYILGDHETQEKVLEGFYREGAEVVDPHYVMRLTLLAYSYQDNIDFCNDWRDVVTLNFMKRFGHSNFYFLNPLEKHLPKSGEERLESLGFNLSGPTLSEAEMRQIWVKAMVKLVREKEYLERLKYDAVAGVPHSS